MELSVESVGKVDVLLSCYRVYFNILLAGKVILVELRTNMILYYKMMASGSPDAVGDMLSTISHHGEAVREVCGKWEAGKNQHSSH